jgi:hypothetical protein
LAGTFFQGFMLNPPRFPRSAGVCVSLREIFCGNTNHVIAGITDIKDNKLRLYKNVTNDRGRKVRVVLKASIAS